MATYGPSDFGLRAQLAEVRREINMRRVFYPKLVRSGRISQEDADKRFACLEAVALTLQKLVTEEAERRQPPLLL